MAQLPDVQPAQPLSGLAPDHQPISRPAQPAAEVLSPPPHCHHGEILHVQQTRMDLVSTINHSSQACQGCTLFLCVSRNGTHPVCVSRQGTHPVLSLCQVSSKVHEEDEGSRLQGQERLWCSSDCSRPALWSAPPPQPAAGPSIPQEPVSRPGRLSVECRLSVSLSVEPVSLSVSRPGLSVCLNVLLYSVCRWVCSVSLV